MKPGSWNHYHRQKMVRDIWEVEAIYVNIALGVNPASHVEGYRHGIKRNAVRISHYNKSPYLQIELQH